MVIAQNIKLRILDVADDVDERNEKRRKNKNNKCYNLRQYRRMMIDLLLYTNINIIPDSRSPLRFYFVFI